MRKLKEFWINDDIGKLLCEAYGIDEGLVSNISIDIPAGRDIAVITFDCILTKDATDAVTFGRGAPEDSGLPGRDGQ